MEGNGYARELRQALQGSNNPGKQIRYAQMCAKGEGGPIDYREAAAMYHKFVTGWCGTYFDALHHYYFGLFYETGQGSSYWVGSPKNMQYDDAPNKKKKDKHFKKARKQLRRAGRQKRKDTSGRPNSDKRADAMRKLAWLLETGRGGPVDAKGAQKLKESATAL